MKKPHFSAKRNSILCPKKESVKTVFQNLYFIIFALLSAIFFISFQNTNPKPMLNLNDGDYTAEWKTIDSLEQQGLPKSALKKVEALYAKAKKENNPSQLIKTLIYKGKYESQLEEDGLVKAIFKLRKEMEEADFPVKPILQSMLAEMYQNYLSNHWWTFQNRTQTVQFQIEDIQTWTIEQLMDESAKWYLASLQNDQLKEVKIEDFEAITTGGKNNELLRPTLYDFLANRAIEYFRNEQSHLTQPANKFYLDREEALLPFEDFIKIKFETQDSNSFKFKTLLLFQELLAHQKESNNAAGLIDAELKRLKFVHENAVLENKDELYLATLDQLSQKFIDSPSVAEVFYQKAAFYFNKGQKYQPNPDEAGKWNWKTAREICEKTIQNYPGSFGAHQCTALKVQIDQKSLSFQTEQVNLPNNPFLSLVQYRNMGKVWMKVIPFDEERETRLEKMRSERDANKKILPYFNSFEPLKQWIENLPTDGDFRQHAAEVKIDGLPFGKYLVMVSDNPEFSDEQGIAGYLFTHVSRMGNWYRTDENGQSTFVVFDRESGAPLEGVKAEFFVRRYNSIFRKNEFKKVSVVTSDENGFLQPLLNEKDYNYQVRFSRGKDVLFLKEGYSNYFYHSEQQPFTTTHFFLDRAIYRPAQTIYFKGIIIQKDAQGMPKIVPNRKITVTFRDVNYQEVEKLELTSNEYGTINGTFTAPRSGLLGQMSLQADVGGAKNFRVEEYKRPKFEVDFEPVEGSFRMDEKVTVKGMAKAYAGSNIDGAKVQYRVVREVDFPWIPGWYWRGGYNPWQSESMEIASGVSTTDAEGKFEIDFIALPDRSVPKDKSPEFSYTVHADVTDITGETHSSQTAVKVGYIALRADIPIAYQVNADSLKKIEISTKNLNGQFEAAKGSLAFELLAAPKKIFIERYWQKPDKQLLAEIEFFQNFPHLSFGDEDEAQNWNVKRLVLKANFDTGNSKEILLPKVKLPPGKYALTLKTKDKFGKKIEVKKYFTLYDLDSKSIPVPTVGWHLLEKKTYEPGEKAVFYFGTTEDSLPLLLEMERDRKIISRKWLHLHDLQKETYAIQEEDLGNVHYHFSFAKHNRSFTRQKTLFVPWSNKDLTYEYGTFRDKLQPGQEEEWIIKIKGPKGEKVAAEMVAAMYDASLDEFAENHWSMNLFPTSYPARGLRAKGFSTDRGRIINWVNQAHSAYPSRSYRHLNWFHFDFYGGRRYLLKSKMGYAMAREAPPSPEAEMAAADHIGEEESEASANGGIAHQKETSAKEGGLLEETKDQENNFAKSDFKEIKVRTNLKETVFFFPNLMTDSEGNVLLKFKMNEALTRWKFLALAHTKDLKTGTTQREVITQKDLMVMPNPPRFFREGDEIEFTAKVVNLTDKPLSGNAQLQLVNPLNSLPVFKWQDNPQFNQNFTVEGGQSARLAWRFKVPDASEVPVVEHTVLAAAGNFSDAERSTAPVLSNRMLVTETLPLPVRGKESKKFAFKNLKNNHSSTLKHQGLTLEFTSNPAWYAVQALPYLMEYPYDCTEQIFARYYANSLASSVANSHPKIKAVFEQWRTYQADALESNLSKNEELKSAVLEETPWVLQAQSEAQQKKNIALLFDLNRMSYERENALAKLAERQMPNGGWAWFPGGRDSRYITQYIVEGLGHLDKLAVADVQENLTTWRMLKDAVRYIDARMVEQYERLEEMIKEGKAKWEDDHLDNMAIHYLYTRSYFLIDRSALANASGDNPTDRGKKYIALDGKIEKVFDYYLRQSEKYWLKKGMYQEGMIALALHRMGRGQTPAKMVKSFKERALHNDEFGMYWKYPSGYWWYQLPIETHSLMIEVFEEVANDAVAVDELKIWLLKNKQTNHWKTTKATSSAVYALLMSGENWLLEDQAVDINLGNNSDWQQAIRNAQKTAEAGTGYFKLTFKGEEVSSDMASIRVKNPNNVVAWGAMYWQYFEQLDKINTFKETPLTLNKQLFKVENSPTGEVLRPITDATNLEPGDMLKVRIELRVDRPMEYVHMKDMRASGFEPINVLSRYKWQGGLGYYESTRDASTNFFFSYLPKGTHVFEYPLRVVHKGDFSNGITTIQSMYAPEFSSHSEGIRVVVD